MSHKNTLSPNKTALVIVDFQEAFRKMIPEFDSISQQISNAVKGFQILNLPIFITEQYPRGLGNTAKEILDVLTSTAKVFEKTAFSSCGEAQFVSDLEEADIKQVLLCGLETHICVNQTAHDLIERDFDIHILEDAIGSRTEENKQIGLSKMKTSGAISSCVEMALFELMKDSKHKHFKDIQALIK